MGHWHGDNLPHLPDIQCMARFELNFQSFEKLYYKNLIVLVSPEGSL